MSRVSKMDESLNSDPNDIWLGCCDLMILSRSKLYLSSILALWLAANLHFLKMNKGGFIGGEPPLKMDDTLFMNSS
jgi:hypothetical protein